MNDTEMSSGGMGLAPLPAGIPKGWPRRLMIDGRREFFQSETEFVEPEMSRMNMFFSAEGIRFSKASYADALGTNTVPKTLTAIATAIVRE